MVSGAAAADAVRRAKAMPSACGVGLHLVLVDGKPILPATEVPDLVDAGTGGRFTAPIWRGQARRCSFLARCAASWKQKSTAQFSVFSSPPPASAGFSVNAATSIFPFAPHHRRADCQTVASASAKGGERRAVPLEPQDILGKDRTPPICTPRPRGADRSPRPAACGLAAVPECRWHRHAGSGVPGALALSGADACGRGAWRASGPSAGWALVGDIYASGDHGRFIPVRRRDMNTPRNWHGFNRSAHGGGDKAWAIFALAALPTLYK